MYFEREGYVCTCPKDKWTLWYHRCRIKKPVQVAWHKGEREHEFIGKNAKNNAKLLALYLRKNRSYGFGRTVKIVTTETMCGVPVYYVVESPSPEEIAYEKREVEKYRQELVGSMEYCFRGSRPGIRRKKKAPRKKNLMQGFCFDFPTSDIGTFDKEPGIRPPRRDRSWIPTRLRYWRPRNNNWKRHRKTQWRNVPCRA